MPKELPQPITELLVPPDRNRHYFEGCAEVPFDANAASCNLCNAWWLAEAAFAVYGSFRPDGSGDLNVQSLLDCGYRIFGDAVGSTQLLAIAKPGVLIVAFRGT